MSFSLTEILIKSGITSSMTHIRTQTFNKIVRYVDSQKKEKNVVRYVRGKHIHTRTQDTWYNDISWD